MKPRYIHTANDLWYDRINGTYSSPHPDVQRARYPGMAPIFDFVDGLGATEDSFSTIDKVSLAGFVGAGLLSAGVGTLVYSHVRNRDRLNSAVQARYEGYEWAMLVGGSVLLLCAGMLHAMAI